MGLVEPDGSSDRLLWKTNKPDAGNLLQIFSLAWNPAASELAFASRHEEACSMYSSDVYSVRADGSGYRRVTAPPSCGGKAGLPTGTVNVSIANYTDASGPFVVYFEGAPGPKSITLAPGNSTIVTFTNVADYGSFKQWGVVIFGMYRFFAVTGNADVIPGTTVNTGSTIGMWEGYTSWGWTNPTWSSDGSEMSYVFDGTTPYSTPAESTAPGGVGSYYFDIQLVDLPSWISFFIRAPAGAHQGQALYTGWAYDAENWLRPYIWLGDAGSTSPGEALFETGDNTGHTILGLTWLPDSSGFLYSQTEGFNEYANIFKYTFANQTSTRLTDFTSGFTRNMSVSPDGAHIVFEYQATGDWIDLSYDLDLWMMDRYGNGQALFVQDARAPAWSPAALPEPVVYDHFVYLPSVLK